MVTRPDNSYACNALAKHMGGSLKEHEVAVLQVLRYLHYTRNRGITFCYNPAPIWAGSGYMQYRVSNPHMDGQYRSLDEDTQVWGTLYVECKCVAISQWNWLQC